MNIREDHDSKAVSVLSGLLRLEKAIEGLMPVSRQVQGIANLVHQEVHRFITGGMRNIELPHHETVTQENWYPTLQTFLNEVNLGDLDQRFTLYTKGVGGLVSSTRSITGALGQLYQRSSSSPAAKLDALSLKLLETDTVHRRPLIHELLLSANQLASASQLFRGHYHEAITPVVARSGTDASASQEATGIRFPVAAPVLDFLLETQDRAPCDDPGEATGALWSNWVAGEGEVIRQVGKDRANCIDNSGDPRMIGWLVSNLSSSTIPIDVDERRKMVPHLNAAAGFQHLRAAKFLNSEAHNGYSDYFCFRLTELLLLREELDRAEINLELRPVHKHLVDQQIAVLLHSFHEHFVSSDGRTAKEHMEEFLSSIGIRIDTLGPYVSSIINNWESLVRQGETHVEEFYQPVRAKEQQSEIDKAAAPIVALKNTLELYRKRNAAIARIVEGETHTLEWQEPIEILGARAQRKPGLFYRRDTWTSGEGKLTKAEAFECALLQELVRESDVLNWVFTDIGPSLTKCAEWMAEQGHKVTKVQLRDALQSWLMEEEESTNLRSYLQSQGLWPAASPIETSEISELQELKLNGEDVREAFLLENLSVTSMVNYWQAIHRARQGLVAEYEPPDTLLYFASDSNEELQIAQEVISRMESKFVDIGGHTAKNKPVAMGNVLQRQDMLGIFHTNMRARFMKDGWDMRYAFEHGAYLAAAKQGYGATHDTSGIMYDRNTRIADGFEQSEVLKPIKHMLGTPFPMRTGAKSDFVLFSPGGPADVPADVPTTDVNSFQPV